MVYLCIECGQQIRKQKVSYRVLRCKDCKGGKKWKYQEIKTTIEETDKERETRIMAGWLKKYGDGE